MHASSYVQGVSEMHVNSIAIYVWRLLMCRSAHKMPVAVPRAQTNPTPDLTLGLILTLTLTQTQPNPSRGSRSALEVGRGNIEFTCKPENLARTCNN